MRSIRLLALAAAGAILATGASAQQLDAANNESPRAWFVELSSPPTVEGTSIATTKAEKQSFRAAARKAGVKLSERFAYDTLFNGISVTVNPADVNALSQVDGVKAVWPVHTYPMPQTAQVSDPDLVTALGMTGADVAQSSLGLTGAGVKVAVMDTGIDYGHPDLGGCFGPGCRVAYGTDLVGDAYNADDADPIVRPDPDPMDCAGHGTHVAGIVGAKAASATGVTGVAPGVTFGAYRVFGCAGSTSDEIMIAAMERALADGMQILNMSIGAAFTWPQSPTAVAATRLVNHGMVVVASFGNSGANGLYSGGAPGLGEKVIGVASFDNVKLNLATFTVTPDGAAIGYLPGGAGATGGGNPPPPPISGSAPMSRTSNSTTVTNDACNPLPAGSLAGTVALVRRGVCSFFIKVQNAQNAGAVGVVIYNNTSGLVTPAVSDATFTPVIPVVSISQADGVTISNRIAAGPVTMTWTVQVSSTPNATANQVSSFSSWGLSPDLTLKPDIGAPGGFIRSTYPRALGTYANLSGTSMASPHVAGAAALYLQAHPGTKAGDLRSLLQNTAVPHNFSTTSFIDATHHQGAGMVQIDKAVLATASVAPGKLSLGESDAGPSTQTLTIANGGASAVTYAVTHEAAISSGANTFTIPLSTAGADVTFSATSVTVPPGGSASVSATIAPSAGVADGGIYGGYVVFTPQAGGQTLRVPFAGYKGNYQSIQVLTPTANGLPRIGRSLGGGSFAFVDGGTFNLTAGDLPNILFHLNHQSRILRMEIFEAATGRAWHRLDDETYVGRNSTAAGYFALPFNGISFIGAKNGQKGIVVPNGTYVVKISVLKALGDESNPADWEYATTPAFTITR